jgi:hypothetical protein
MQKQKCFQFAGRTPHKDPVLPACDSTLCGGLCSARRGGVPLFHGRNRTAERAAYVTDKIRPTAQHARRYIEN